MMPKKNYRSEIIESAKKLIAKNGYEKLNMRSIAKGAGVKAASIYNHFKTKDEMIYILIFDGRVKLAELLRKKINKAQTIEDKILAYYDGFIEFGFENREFYKIMFMNSYPAEAMRNVKNEIAREIEPGLNTLSGFIQEYTGLSSESSMVLAESFFHITHGHISLSIIDRADFLFDVKKVRKQIKEIIFHYLDNVKYYKLQEISKI